jgi:hypothetical protein
MREFFHGWRRKAGCVVLLIAAAAMVGHVRSHYCWDWIELHLPLGNELEIHSQYNTARFVYKRITKTKGIPPKTSVINWIETKFTKVYTGWEWQRPHWGKFGWTSSGTVDGREHEIGGWRVEATLPYTALTMPLALLAACLILWKPRKRMKRDA